MTIQTKLVFLLPGLLCSFQMRAQEKETLTKEINIELVNQYVWRGVYLSGASIQPSATLGFKNLEFTVWGSTAFSDSLKEVDLSLSYTLGFVKLGIIDYWSGNVLNTYNKEHAFEGNLMLASEDFPLSLEWNTLFYGDAENTGSSYAELAYIIRKNNWIIGLSAGVTPWANEVLETEGFAVTKAAFTLGKTIQIKDRLDLGCTTSLIYNPSLDQMFWTLGVGVSFN